MITRFAPSPTGPLHLGHAYSALLAFDMAKAAGGQFLLRMENIDRVRGRLEWETQIYDDLHWLGLDWREPVMRQSERMPVYRAALARLWQRGLLYPCTCRRRDVLAAATSPQEGDGPLVGPDGIVYPGTCRGASHGGSMPEEALRLDMRKAVEHTGGVSFFETGFGTGGERGRIDTTAQHLVEQVGDVVLARRDLGTSYHLAVVIDDAAQEVTHVIRGQDLFDATAIHVVLQRLLDLPAPTYHHHKLIRDTAGKRLAKRNDARAIGKYRKDGLSPVDLRDMVGL